MQDDAKQRQLLRAGRPFLQFFRVGLFIFLITGFAALLWTLLVRRTLYPLALITPWILCNLFLIRMVSVQMDQSAREEHETQDLGD